MAYTMLPKLIYSHLHAVTVIMELFVFEISGNSYADPGSLLTDLQTETQNVPSKDEDGKIFLCSTLPRQEPGQRSWYSNSLSDPAFEFRQGTEIAPFSKKNPDRIYHHPVGTETLSQDKPTKV